ncbi:fungal-specific transcription factor domain-containing protein [Aspergillus pseudotamarii]|uniref:Fungal-specific transcription factor domain-containing protein n=1 Tax=Aspergillus pseudotamarii TaxID=132259 RepID=A0A5N6SN48_ASPPS|nr:fungal-specific transcription factor domain-containing protein [Aspergillus pseudotamarii]KAE8135190.1 fungal-specific transcription factor domain-containing protein [Aspergillus pseudotamarii]
MSICRSSRLSDLRQDGLSLPRSTLGQYTIGNGFPGCSPTQEASSRSGGESQEVLQSVHATAVRQEKANVLNPILADASGRPKSPPLQGDGSTGLNQDATLATPTNTGKTTAQDASNVLAGEAAGGSWPKVLSRLREAFCLDPQGGLEEQRIAVGQAQMSHPTALHHAELDRLESAVHAFPPYSIASFLLSVLIKHATDTFFYVDQAEFASEIHRFYTDPTSPLRSDSSFVCLAMAAFALASQWTTLEKPEGHQLSAGLEKSDLGRVFFDHARTLIPDIIERPCLQSVQAPFVLGVYLMPASAIGSSYVYLGLALRKALALDLHQDVDDQKMNEREIEVRRRLWWSLYSLERCTTVKLNRPRSISAAVITTPLPSPLPALDHSQKFDNLSFQLAYMRLVKILDHISDPELGNTGDELALQARYESDLKEWKRSLPPEFTLQDTDPQDSRYRAVFHLYLHYYYAWITIGKASLVSVVRAKLRSCVTGSQLPQISNVARNLSRSCAKAARKLLGLFETMSMSHKITRFSFTDFQGCSIATIVTLLDGITQRDSGYEARVAFGLEHLRQMAIGNVTAKMGVRFVEAIQLITNEAREKVSRSACTAERTSQGNSRIPSTSEYSQWALWLMQQEQAQGFSERTSSLSVVPETMTPLSPVGQWPSTHNAAGLRPAWPAAERQMFSPTIFSMQNLTQESDAYPEAQGADYEFLPMLHHDEQTFLMELTGLGVLDVSGLSNPLE